MFLQIDGTFILQIVNFFVFLAILNVVFLKPVGAAIAKRRQYIDSVTSDYEQHVGEAKALRAQAENLRAEARREAEAKAAAYRNETEDQVQAIADEYGAKVQALVESAHETVAGELAAARAKEPQLVEQLAQTMVARAMEAGSR
jgi:F-type H+-transporting ATPase subunit b